MNLVTERCVLIGIGSTNRKCATNSPPVILVRGNQALIGTSSPSTDATPSAAIAYGCMLMRDLLLSTVYCIKAAFHECPHLFRVVR